MKKQTTTPFSQISKSQIENLTNVVTETIAVGFTPVKTFSTVDLWNIQRRSRTMMHRRSFV